MFQTLQQSILNYIQTEYLYGTAEASASCEYSYRLRIPVVV